MLGPGSLFDLLGADTEYEKRKQYIQHICDSNMYAQQSQAKGILPRNTVAHMQIRHVVAPINGSISSQGHILDKSISSALAAAVVLSSISSPLLLPNPSSSADALPDQAALEHRQEQPVASLSAPDVHAAPEDPQIASWWQSDADAWLELTSSAELSAFLSSSVPVPAWPYHESEALVPKLRVVEFYATWCPACRAAAPGMAALAKDPQLQPTCTFARANADRVKPVLKQLGITKIPTALIISPDGLVLDAVRASDQVVRDALLQHAAALAKVPVGATPPAVTTGPSPSAADDDESLLAPTPEELLAPEINGLSDEHQIIPSTNANMSSISTAAASDDGDGSNDSSSSGSSVVCGLVPNSSTCGACPPAATTATTSSGQQFASSPAAAAAATALPPGLESAKRDFLQQYKGDYGYQGWLDQHYDVELGDRLGAGHHYLDYTGAALYLSSLLEGVYSDLMVHTYGNLPSLAAPGSSVANIHSTAAAAAAAASDVRVSPAAASELVMESAALTVLQHMKADPAQYQVVFTRSATEALKLVGEMFPWTAASSGSSSSCSSASQFIYTRSNHNSVLGVGAYAAAAGATLVPRSDLDMHHWMVQQQQQQQPQPLAIPEQLFPSHFDQDQQQQEHDSASNAAVTSSISPRYHLVAYPAEDNFAGVMYPLDWVNQLLQAHAASSSSDRYLVLLDAAAHLPSHPLDLSAHPADFVAVSFYKMFGYPTGLGALLVRTELVPLLNKVYFGGGSVSLATPEGCWHVGRCDPSQALTDGTPNFLGAAALHLAYDNWDSRGGIKAVELHTQALSRWLEQQLTSLHHCNGAPLLQLFGNHPTAQQHQQPLPASFGQGAIFNFQVLESDGTPISYLRVEREAAAAGLDLRSGCVCNPGACYDSLGLHADEVQGLAGVKEGCGDEVELVTVMRPANSDWLFSKTTGTRSSDGGGLGSSEQQQQQPLVAKQIPLGSVRASLGWASIFEDVYMLVEFLKSYVT